MRAIVFVVIYLIGMAALIEYDAHTDGGASYLGSIEIVADR